ncbi:MAG: hypothetical protein ABIN25_08735 [Ginsengibacter sp.]
MIFSYKINDRKRWLIGCLFFFIQSCSPADRQANFAMQIADSLKQEENIEHAINKIAETKKIVKEGDLIMRTGKDFTSELMRLSSANDKTYSHCGIASFENDSLFVYHAIGGEWNPDERLRRDIFEVFCNPYENKGIGIFRYIISNKTEAKLFKIIDTLYTCGVKFDMQFDLASNDRMYCSEFVYKAIEQASDHKIILPITTFKNIKFVAPDNLYRNPFCKEIFRLAF